MSAKLNGTDLFNSLTGFDEIAIAQRFGRTVTDLGSADPTMFGRALVFVDRRRDGATDDAAWDVAMNMPLKEVSDIAEGTAADEDEATDEESGKGEPLVPDLEPQPETSLSSVS